MPLWFQTETRVRTHPKMVKAGRAASWTWVCGNCYAKDQMTDGFIPDGMLASLVPGASLRDLKKDADALVAAGLWDKVDGGYQIHDYLEYNDSKAEILAKQEEDRNRKRKHKSEDLPLGILMEDDPESNNPAVSVSGSGSDAQKKDVDKKAHPIRELLGEHLAQFQAKHGVKPAKYTGKDAKHAESLIVDHGLERAKTLVRQAFLSTDPFVAKSGHSMGVIVSSAVQNRLIAELASQRRPQPSTDTPKSLRVIDQMEAAKRHVG